MAKGGGGFAGKPAKGTMSGKAYGKAVSAAAKAKMMPDIPRDMPMKSMPAKAKGTPRRKS